MKVNTDSICLNCARMRDSLQQDGYHCFETCCNTDEGFKIDLTEFEIIECKGFA